MHLTHQLNRSMTFSRLYWLLQANDVVTIALRITCNEQEPSSNGIQATVRPRLVPSMEQLTCELCIEILDEHRPELTGLTLNCGVPVIPCMFVLEGRESNAVSNHMVLEPLDLVIMPDSRLGFGR